LAGELQAEAGPGDLREGEGLVPVHPAAAVLDVVPAPRGGPGAASEPVARLEQQGRPAVAGRLPGGGDAGEPAADHDDVVRAVSHEWYKCTTAVGDFEVRCSAVAVTTLSASGSSGSRRPARRWRGVPRGVPGAGSSVHGRAGVLRAGSSPRRPPPRR